MVTISDDDVRVTNTVVRFILQFFVNLWPHDILRRGTTRIMTYICTFSVKYVQLTLLSAIRYDFSTIVNNDLLSFNINYGYRRGLRHDFSYTKSDRVIFGAPLFFKFFLSYPFQFFLMGRQERHGASLQINQTFNSSRTRICFALLICFPSKHSVTLYADRCNYETLRSSNRIVIEWFSIDTIYRFRSESAWP